MWWQAVRPQPWSAGSTTATRPWRISIRIAALDPYRGYASAVRSVLGTAVRVLDAFHVVRLGFAAVDAVRCRIQDEQTGHRAPVTRSTGSVDCCAGLPTTTPSV